jgi:2'-5' RNA ligase
MELNRLLVVRNQIQPFELSWGRIGCFLIPQRVIYLAVEPTPGLLEARQKLLEALQLDDQRPFTPHLTLAKGIGPAEFDRLLAQLEQTEWRVAAGLVWVDQLRVMQRRQNEAAWRCIQQLDLLKGQ